MTRSTSYVQRSTGRCGVAPSYVAFRASARKMMLLLRNNGVEFPQTHGSHALLICAFLMISISGTGQSKVLLRNAQLDTLYVHDYSKRPTVRIYSSHKFNSLVVRAEDPFTDVRYRPNGQINLGVGMSYRTLTLNIGLRMPFVNDDEDAKGKTRFLDAQANVYGARQASNLFLQIYRGYHITSHDKVQTGWTQPTDQPYRGDLVQYNIGISSLRMANHTRFSYRATFNQDAWQQRSQGSWLYGGYMTAYVVQGDSGLVPTALQPQFNATTNIQKGVFVDAGPMGGYAHTVVYKRHWFITGSAALGAGVSTQYLRIPSAEGATRTTDVGPGWHVQFRAGAGYNSRRYFAGVLFNQEHIGYLLRDQSRFAWDVGNVRIILAKRLVQRPKRIDRGLRWLDKETPVPIP